MHRTLVLALSMTLALAAPLRADDVGDEGEESAVPEIAPKPEEPASTPSGEADPDASERERLRRAREEQAAARAEEDAQRRAAEEEAERRRLEEVGAAGGEGIPEEEPGFFITVDGFLADPSGAERSVAHESVIETAAVTAEDLDTDGDEVPDAFTVTGRRDVVLEYDAELSPQIEIGWRRKGGGALSARFWSWSASAEVAAGSSLAFASADPALGGLFLGSIDNPGIENALGTIDTNPGAFERPLASPRTVAGFSLHGADGVVAASDLEATRIDLFYSRTAIASRRIELSWRAGLTHVALERTLDARYEFRSFSRTRVLQDAFLAEDVSAGSDMDGIGATVGGAARIGFTQDRRWSFRIGADVSGIQSDAEVTFRDATVFEQQGLPPTLDVIQDVVDDASDFVTILDGEVSVEHRFGQRARVAVGYRHATWLSVLVNDHFPSAVNPAIQESTQEDLDFSGPYVRVGFFF